MVKPRLAQQKAPQKRSDYGILARVVLGQNARGRLTHAIRCKGRQDGFDFTDGRRFPWRAIYGVLRG